MSRTHRQLQLQSNIDRESDHIVDSDHSDFTTYSKEEREPNRSHTWTKKSLSKWSSLQTKHTNIVINIGRRTVSDNGYMIIPITVVDKLLSAYSCSITLNTPEQWEEFITMLEQNNVEHSYHYCAYSNTIRHIYKLPVIDNIHCNKTVQATNHHGHNIMDDHSWFQMNGKRYDPNMLYSVNLTETLSAHPQIQTLRPLGDTEMTFSDQSIVRLNQYSSTRSTQIEVVYDYMNKFIRPVHKSDIEHIIKFKGETQLTHLRLFPGTIPVTLYPTVDSYQHMKKSWRKKYNVKHRIYAVKDPHRITYVKTFSIYYKPKTVNTWLHLGNFNGITNPYQPAVIDFSGHYNVSNALAITELKIVVQEFHQFPSFNYELYGRRSVNDTNDCVDTVSYAYNEVLDRPQLTRSIGQGHHDLSWAKHINKQQKTMVRNLIQIKSTKAKSETETDSDFDDYYDEDDELQDKLMSK